MARAPGAGGAAGAGTGSAELGSAGTEGADRREAAGCGGPQARPELGPELGPAAAGSAGRLFFYSGGFLTRRRERRILQLAGWRLTPGFAPGLPRAGERVAVWGRSPTAWRGERIAARRGAALLRVEDAFLRSVHPGRRGEPPLGLLADRTGVHFDASAPSDLERLLAGHPLDDPALLARARDGIARLREGHLSKYNAFDPAALAPEGPFVLVVDQTRGDAALGGAGRPEFAALLARARAEHPGARILLRVHPESAAGLRPGHFTAADATAGAQLFAAPVSPWRLLAGATAVYTFSSQLGFEAILAGHRPVVAGRPFHAGWGLSTDLAGPLPRRGRRLTAEQLFAAAMLLAPLWYDPFRDRLCPFETAVDILEAQVRAWREDRRGYAAWGMRAWKRAPLQGFLGRERPVRFAPGAAGGRVAVVWASAGAGAAPGAAPAPSRLRAGRAAPAGALRMEDGFLRSRGLGAALVPPLSLVLDDLGIYYDPARESRLERLIAASAALPPPALARAEALRRAVIAAGVSKYNLGGGLPPLPEGRRILIPGQVEDDASLRLGAGAVRTNLGLLTAARAANPAAVLIYKPHPDVQAGLRPGALAEAEVRRHADVVLAGGDMARLAGAVDEVWTLTSLAGFEALLRGTPVTCLGTPFYAGWGLTRDLGPPCARRRARPPLAGLVHAALIAYPRYRDPLTGLPCPPEVAVERLADPGLPRGGGPGLRVLARVQGWLAGYAWLWR